MMHIKKIISRVVVVLAACLVMISLNVAIEAFTTPSNNLGIRLAHSSTINRLRLFQQSSSSPSLLQSPIVITEHVDDNIQSNQIDGRIIMEQKVIKEEKEEVPSTWKQALHRFFLGDIGPPLVVLSISGFIYTRIQLLSSVPFTITEFAIFISAIILWSFQEYFLHRVALHSQNFNWIGKSIHQTHHDKDYFHISIDPPVLLVGWLFAAHLIIKTILPSWHLCLSATIGYALAGLVYEWSHYIVHTKVKAPQSSSSILVKLFLQMRNNHMRHHLVDDRYWYAFSVPAMDDLFDTNPDVRDVRKRENSKVEKRDEEDFH